MAKTKAKAKPKKPDRMSGEYQRAVGDFVRREVVYCVSTLIHELAQNPEHMDELYPVLSQDDYETPAREAGWEGPEPDKYGAPTYTDKTDGATWCAGSWEELCSAHDIEPHRVEAYEHWVISEWLADKLEERGEMILRDFLGLTIWGRTTSGQAISMDGVICDIYDALQVTP
jgi:hypothetical protein